MPFWKHALSLAESGRLPDSLVRLGIRQLIGSRARELDRRDPEQAGEVLRRFLTHCESSKIAVLPEMANEQHYEVPAEFFRQMLGPRLKYSCCHWGSRINSLQAAEESALALTCQHAHLEDGLRILELGCGWGSLTLWMAEQFPGSRITAVSNSSSQRRFIESQTAQRDLQNVEVITADMNEFDPQQSFDRVVSVEMFEHMRNHALLLQRISDWLTPGGLLLVHVFCHREQPYFYEDHGPQDWMTRYFFSGGMMPSDGLLLRYQRDLTAIDHWRWSGVHYQQTCNAWLETLDSHRDQVLPVLADTYGDHQARVWLQRWRIFLMACAELFGWREGREWWVSHYLFEKPMNAGRLSRHTVYEASLG